MVHRGGREDVRLYFGDKSERRVFFVSAFTESTPCGLVLAKALHCVRHCFVNAGK